MLKQSIKTVLRTIKIYLERAIVVLISLFFFNYSTLSSANCQSFCELNKIFENAYTELLIIVDDSGESIALPDSFCEVDLGTEDSSDEDDSDFDHCAYCHACSIGMTFQHVPPVVLDQAIIIKKKIFNHGRSSVNQKITLTHPQRAPPLPT